MTEKAVKPEIRFAGFNDAWEQRKLGEMERTYTGLSVEHQAKVFQSFGHGDMARFAPADIADQMYLASNPISNPDNRPSR